METNNKKRKEVREKADSRQKSEQEESLPTSFEIPFAVIMDSPEPAIEVAEPETPAPKTVSPRTYYYPQITYRIRKPVDPEKKHEEILKKIQDSRESCVRRMEKRLKEEKEISSIPDAEEHMKGAAGETKAKGKDPETIPDQSPAQGSGDKTKKKDEFKDPEISSGEDADIEDSEPKGKKCQDAQPKEDKQPQAAPKEDKQTDISAPAQKDEGSKEPAGQIKKDEGGAKEPAQPKAEPKKDNKPKKDKGKSDESGYIESFFTSLGNIFDFLSN